MKNKPEPACTTCQYDVAIIGGGPCGIAAAIALRSEGASVVVLDQDGPGGQVATSSKIENVFGAPVGGLTGSEMMARGIDQAAAFGAQFRSPFRAVRVEKDPETGIFTIVAANRAHITAAAVVLAIGASYRRIEAEGIEKFSGRGVAYGSPQYRVPSQWEGKRVGIVGGGNSAGQASLFLSHCEGCEVNVFVRGNDLESDMSFYLRKHVQQATNIVVHPHSKLKEVKGTPEWMTGIVVENGEGVREVPLDYLLVQIGAEPQTGWLDESGDSMVALDDRGYILTDRDIPKDKWPASAGRAPYPFETSLPGMFTGGDVHAGSPNRMSVAIGEGPALSVSVFKYLVGLHEHAAKAGQEIVSSVRA